MSVHGIGGAGRARFEPEGEGAGGATAGARGGASEASVRRGSSPRNLLASHALGEALLNDRKGTVDAKDAQKVVEAALAEIAGSRDPAKTFAAARKTVASALGMASTKAARTILESFEAKGRSAVAARTTALAGAGSLPESARDELVTHLRDHGVLPERGTAKVKLLGGDATKGFDVEVTVGSKTVKAAIQRYEGRWFFAPAKVDKKSLDKATAEFRKYFDTAWAPELKDMGATRAEIADARAKLLPTAAIFPGEESDPQGYVDEYPLVLHFANETGSDYGCFAGVDPRTGKVDVYTFN